MIRLVCFGAVALWAAPAYAHGTLPGGGGFYAGAAHPFLAVEHLALLLGFGLILGRRAVLNRTPLAWLALGLAAGLTLGALGIGWTGTPVVVLVAALAAGLGLALAVSPSGRILSVAAASVGLAVGLDTGVPAPSGVGGVAAWLPYAGVFVGVYLIVLNAAALGTVARRPIMMIGVRVAGSWIAAFSLMVLALEIRRRGGGT